jgi:hypothetical protein
MKKFIAPTYTFTPGASGVGTVNLSGITGFDVKNLVAIINQTDGVVIYSTGSQTLKYTNVSGTTVTLFFDTTGMSSGDTLQVIYEDNLAIAVEPILVDKDGNEVNQLATFSGGAAVGNSINRISDNFASGNPNPLVWDEVWANQADSFVERGGNANGSSYLKISLSPFQLDSEYRLISKDTFDIPSSLGVAYSASQRVLGQEFSFGFVGCDDNGNIEYTAPKPDVALPATLTVSSNVATITFAAPHSFVGNDRVVLYGNAVSALNVGPVLVTVVSQLIITVPMVTANATYNCSGFIKFADPLAEASNSVLLHTGDTNSVSSMTFASRRGGQSARATSISTASSAALVTGTSNFTDAFMAANIIELQPSPDDVVAVSRSSDSVTSPQTPVRFTQGYPDESKKYKVFIRAKNHARLPRPIARIVSATKSGTSTATFVTDVAHNLNLNSRITIYGIRDATNFPNVVTTIAPVSIVNATTFTAVIGSTTTGTSAGGFVGLCDANTAIAGGNFPQVQSITRTNNALQITCVTTVTGLVSGETIHLYGCNAVSMGLYDGAYKVTRINGSIIVVDSIGPDIVPTNCGGGILKRTDFRIHMVRLNDFLRHTVEISSNGSGDSSKGIPVTGTVAVSTIASGNVTVSSGTVFLSGGSIDNIANTVYVNGSVDITSSANPLPIYKTNSTTYTSFGGTYGTSAFDYYSASYGDTLTVTANVSAITGSAYLHIYTSPDNGTTYNFCYSIGPINSSGVYSSPTIPLPSAPFQLHLEPSGGSSITLSAVSVFSNQEPVPVVKYSTKNFSPTTVGSITPSIECEDLKNFQLTVRNSAQTTAATITLEFSYDQDNWWASPTTLTTVNGTSKIFVTNELWSYVRARTSVAGAGITLQDITIKGMV